MIILAALGGVAYIAYDLKQKDELNVESFQGELSKHWKTAKEQSSKLAEMSKEQLNKLKIKWDEQYSKLDWQKIKQTLKISDKDLEEYKKFMKWAHSDEVEQEAVQKVEALKSHSKPEQVSSSKPDLTAQAELPRRDTKALELLGEAKALNRKAIPNQPDYQKNLKKSVQAYELAAGEYEKLLASPDLSRNEKTSYENTLSKINQQIYWGKKFTSL